MKVFEFKDGSFINVTDTSSVTRLSTVVSTYAEVDAMRAYFTEENMSEVTFDGVPYTDLLPVSCSAVAESGENITVIFVNQFTSDAEIQTLRQQVAQLTVEKAELEEQNYQLSDKAEAADILLGNEEV